jgi:hypothetical protein
MRWDHARTERPRGTSGRLTAGALKQDQRQATLHLGADVLLERARDLYRQTRRAGRGSPFCQRCTDFLARRQFSRLCHRCLLRISHHHVHRASR